MTRYIERFEGTNGVSARTGTTFSSTYDFPSATGTLEYSTTHAMHGSSSLRVVNAASGNAVALVKTIAGSKDLAARFYVYMTDTPDNGLSLFGFFIGSTRVGDIRFNSTTKLRFTAAGSSSDHRWTATNNFPMSQWVRVEVYAKVGTTTSNSELRVAYYLGDSTTAVEDSGLLTGNNLGTSNVTDMRLGVATTSTEVGAFWIDSSALDDAATGLIGIPANEAPTVSAGTGQTVSSGATVNLTGTASDPDGSIASVAWSYVSATSTGSPTLTGGTTLTPTFTAGTAPQVYTLQLSATDDGGASSTSTVEVRVPASGSSVSRPLPFAATKTGTWTRVGGATTDGGALADELNTSYLESGTVSATEQKLRFRLQPTALRASGAVQLTLGMDSGTGTWQIRLYEGNTVVQTWTQASVPATPTDYEFTLSGGTVAAITNWDNLSLEAGVTT